MTTVCGEFASVLEAGQRLPAVLVARSTRTGLWSALVPGGPTGCRVASFGSPSVTRGVGAAGAVYWPGLPVFHGERGFYIVQPSPLCHGPALPAVPQYTGKPATMVAAAPAEGFYIGSLLPDLSRAIIPAFSKTSQFSDSPPGRPLAKTVLFRRCPLSGDILPVYSPPNSKPSPGSAGVPEEIAQFLQKTT